MKLPASDTLVEKPVAGALKRLAGATLVEKPVALNRPAGAMKLPAHDTLVGKPDDRSQIYVNEMTGGVSIAEVSATGSSSTQCYRLALL